MEDLETKDKKKKGVEEENQRRSAETKGGKRNFHIADVKTIWGNEMERGILWVFFICMDRQLMGRKSRTW